MSRAHTSRKEAAVRAGATPVWRPTVTVTLLNPTGTPVGSWHCTTFSPYATSRAAPKHTMLDSVTSTSISSDA